MKLNAFSTDEGGRKYATMRYLLRIGTVVGLAAFLKALLPALRDLDLAALTQLYALMSGVGATFMGVNGWVSVRSQDPVQPVPMEPPGE